MAMKVTKTSLPGVLVVEPDVFPDQYGSQASLMERYNITAEAVAANIRALINDSSVSI